MKRYKLTIEYNGTPFVGWQRQENGLSIQQVIEEAFSKFIPHPVHVYGSGRTDAGVHALGQVAHVDVDKDMSSDQIQGALNAFLRPHPIAVLSVKEVNPDFHARFSAKKKTYMYTIVNRRAPLVLQYYRAWHIKDALDIAAMRQATQLFIGRHDFSAFRAAKCQASSPIKNVDSFEVEQQGEQITAMICAQSFLHNQIRIFMGTLVEIGRGIRTLQNIERALKTGHRVQAGITAPPHGLYLHSVNYE